MTKKTRFEKPDTKKTAATFSTEEFLGLAAVGLHARAMMDRYYSKMLSRPPNPRLDDQGRELLSPVSMVADIDMYPLTPRQNMARFVQDDPNAYYDTETETDQFGRVLPSELHRDEDYNPKNFSDDNPPTPHEVRALKLDRKLSAARAASQKAADEAKASGDTPTVKEQTPPPPSKDTV